MKCERCGYDDLGTGSAHVCTPMPVRPTNPPPVLAAPVSGESFADNAEVRRILVGCLQRLGEGRLAPSLQKRILKVLHPDVKIPKRTY